jgi:hypothetical protein
MIHEADIEERAGSPIRKTADGKMCQEPTAGDSASMARTEEKSSSAGEL